MRSPEFPPAEQETRVALDMLPDPVQQAGSGESDDSLPAWELVDTGRYRPRRIRGSFRGRELG